MKQQVTDRNFPLFNRLAETIAWIINPLIAPPILLGWVALRAGGASSELRWVFGTALLFYFILPGIMLLILRRTGLVESVDVRNRTNRFLPMLIGLILSMAAIPALAWAADASFFPVVPLTVCLVVNTAATMGITSRFKISLHAAAIAGCLSIATMLIWLMPWSSHPLLPFLWLLLPLVMWSRVQTQAHSKLEVLSGAVFGCGISILEVTLLHVFGYLSSV